MDYALLQFLITDALHDLWGLQSDYHGDILLFVDGGGFRSLPPVVGNHYAAEAYARPLVYALTGFDKNYNGLVRLEINEGNLSDIHFSDESQQRSDQLKTNFSTWLKKWNKEETAEMEKRGYANRLRSQMIDGMDVFRKIDRRIGRMGNPELTFISWAIMKITGVAGYTGRLILRWREGGIMSATPAISKEINRKSLKKALKPLLPDARFSGEITLTINRGLINDLKY